MATSDVLALLSARRLFGVLLLALLSVTTGCLRYYEAEVSGYVKDGVSEEGVTGARVRIYFDSEDPGSYQETLTQTVNGADGYFVFRRVVWSAFDPVFGDEGDLTDIRLIVEHEDYAKEETDLRLVSGAGNAVGDIFLDRQFFITERVEGRVRDREEDADREHPGINGLTVELYVPEPEVETLEQAEQWIAENKPDAVANTVTQEEEPGFFAFDDVKWKIEGETPAAKDERGTPRKVVLRVKDANHFTRVVPDVEIVSGETASVVDDIFVDKKEYEGTLEGFVTDLATGEGVNGVSVEVYVPDEPLVDLASVETWIDEHDPVATGTTTTDEDEDEGYYRVTGVRWEIEAEPSLDDAHQRAPVILVLDAGGYREEILYDDADAPGFEPALFVTSNREHQLPSFALSRTDFRGNVEGYVRLVEGEATEGRNGVELFLYYDPDDPDLSELEAFDPYEVDFRDQTSTQDHELRDEIVPGYFSFANLGWDREGGGSLTGGRDRITVIVYSKGVDFSLFEGNEDPSWQRFTVVSDDGDDELAERADFTTLPDLQYRPTRFSGAVEGYVRQVGGDRLSGQNGVTVKLYYDEEDPDLSELSGFDPDDVDWTLETTTANAPDSTEPSAGWFRFTDLLWKNPAGPSVGLDKDRLTFVLYSDEIDFSGLAGNEDPRWHRFTITSGDAPGTVPDLQHFQTRFNASLEGYVRAESGTPASGVNGVELKVYYDPEDPDLTGATAFDPTTASFADVVTTRDRTLAEQIYPGSFRVSNVAWRRPSGASLASGKDRVTVILYSPEVDFSSFEGNTDPTWQRFTLISGDEGNTLADLPLTP